MLLTADMRVKLSDFGLARRRGSVPDEFSYLYDRHAAPELFEGRPESEASDVYALGMTVFRLLCGDAALPVVDESELEQLVRSGEYPPRNRWPMYVHTTLRRVVEKATQKNPTKRYESAREFRLALEQAAPVVEWEPFDEIDGRVRFAGSTTLSVRGGSKSWWKTPAREWEVTLSPKRKGAEVVVRTRTPDGAWRRVNVLCRKFPSYLEVVEYIIAVLDALAIGKDLGVIPNRVQPATSPTDARQLLEETLTGKR